MVALRAHVDPAPGSEEAQPDPTPAPGEVAATLAVARHHRLRVAPQATGHNAAPEMDTVASMPAPGMVRLHQDPEPPMPGVGGHVMIDRVTPEAMRAFVELTGPGSGSPFISSEIRHLGGAAGRPAPGGGGLSHALRARAPLPQLRRGAPVGERFPRGVAARAAAGAAAGFDPATQIQTNHPIDRELVAD